ncbi:WD-repeat protein, putative [Rhizoctonia solani AG-1 IB]|uniref:WD-repeat protein, putative n=1 Tax=Thanatephorus cucumeris (strain AG1-IB / isolate 7/3/14) TaxID=1108050 RepID=A0A0B7FV36_THACB|nr:WD-repeat protein, putative [Rhizoctonia solani AG-1 IB]
MNQVQKGLLEFVSKINEISGFRDESINRTFEHFAEELSYRVGALERLNYDRNEALQWRMNELTAAYGQHLGGMCHALQSFQKTSIPIIQRAQEHRGLGLQGLSAVATFFSGITASAIQYEISDIPTPLQSAVNGLWILSLACSVASAVSAQAVFFWCTSKFSSPTKYTPGVEFRWIAFAFVLLKFQNTGFIGRVLLYTPLAYLSCSVFTFMVGLSVFTFSSEQHIVVSVLVTVFTGIVSFKLVVFGSWIALEHLAYSQTKGEHWLLQIPMSRFARDTIRYLASKTKPSKQSRTAQESTNPKPDDDAEKGSQPKSQPSSKLDRRAPSKARKETLRAIIQSKKISDFKDQYRNSGRESSIYVTHADKVYINNLKLSAVVPQHNGLIKHLAFNPKDQSLLATCGWDGRALISSINQNISLKFPLDHSQNNGKDSSDQPQDDQQSPTVGKPPIEEASVQVREVAWSLDGMMLATRTSEVVRIWDAENGNLLKTIQRDTTKPSRRSVEGIAWTTFINENASPQSNGEKHESEDKNKRKDEGREGNTNRGETKEVPMNKRKDKDKLKPCLLVIEHVCELEENQQVVKSTDITRHYLPTQDTSYRDLKSAWSNSKHVTANVPTNIISVGVVDNSSLIAIGTDAAVNNAKSEVEKFIFLLNFFRPDFKNSRKSPLTGAVRNISVTTHKDTALALVIYKYQGTYPQLWSIRLKSDPYKSHFKYVQSYFSKATADFSGRGCFGGLNDSYVCCSSQEGEIFVWNRVTGLLIGRINFVDDEHVKFFACNKLDYPAFQCASGAVDGLLSLWTASDAERTSESRDIIEGLPGRTPLGSPGQILPVLHETKAYID